MIFEYLILLIEVEVDTKDLMKIIYYSVLMTDFSLTF